jgi:hypothetical protein
MRFAKPFGIFEGADARLRLNKEYVHISDCPPMRERKEYRSTDGKKGQAGERTISAAL